MDILNYTVCELLEKIKNKELTKQEVLDAYKNSINNNDLQIVAFITKNLDAQLEENENELSGIPIGIKDNILTKGVKTTCASKMLENFVAPYNATVVEKIKEVGLVSLGKLNMDEFAMGGSTENSALLKTKNPWDLNRVPGGSSGGSAAAVAGNLVPWALGSDTGGSIRQPASFCGVVGLKPTYGLVSRYSLVAFASSLDQIGPITKDVKDSALLLNIIAGHDPKDSTSKNVAKVDYLENIEASIKGKKIGVPKEFFAEGINPEVKKIVENAIETYKKLGAEIEDFSFKIADESLATYYIIACAEASSNLGRFDGIRYGYRTQNYSNLKELFVNSRTEGFGEEVKRRIILGTYVLSSEYYDAYYKKAQQVRTYIISKFKEAFKKYDVILTPTSPDVAFKIGEKISNPLEMYLADICTVPVNIAGLPAISIPCGVNSNNMPIGMQLIGDKFQEKTILNMAYNFEKEFKFREKYKI